jgi:hypothetical protein
MLTALLMWLTQVALAGCDFDAGAADAPFEARAHSAGVVVFEIRLVGKAQVPTALLNVLAKRGLPATMLVGTNWARRHGDALRGQEKLGHEIGVWFSIRNDLGLTSQTVVVPDFGDWIVALRRARADVRRATGQRPRAVGIKSLPEVAELAMEALGYKVLLPDERNIDDLPRRARSYTGAAGQARVIGIGPYDDGCGATLPAWTPAALDRASSAVARGRWVRVVLPSDPDAAPLLAKWLDEVVIPQGWAVVQGITAVRRARRPLGLPLKLEDTPTSMVPVTRTVPKDTWVKVAEALIEPTTLPRKLPGDLSPTEAFLGLCLLVSDAPATGTVSLGPLGPPVETARTGLGATEVALSPDAVRVTATELAPGLSGAVPSLVSVGDQTLTAAEFLRVLAMVSLNQAPVARGVSDPDPFAPGGGWGVSKGL